MAGLEGRLPTDVWVGAHVRQCIAEAVPVTVARKGDPGGGMLLLKLNQYEAGCRVLSQTRDADGEPAWMAAMDGALMPETEADAYIARAIARDPDIWVLEIEHKEGWHPFAGRVL